MTRKERQVQSREALVEAARQALAASGLRCTLEEIAERAGLTKGAVYSNFGSKEELIRQALTYPDSGPEADLSPLFDSTLTLADQIRGFVSNALLQGPPMDDSEQAHVARLAHIEQELFALRDRASMERASLSNRLALEALAPWLEKRVTAAGGTLTLPAVEVMTGIITLVRGALPQATVIPGSLSVDTVAELAVALVLGAMTPAPEPAMRTRDDE
jgi:AcrR family transcriptional regulator